MIQKPYLLLKELASPPGNTFIFLLTLGLPLAFIPWFSIDSWMLICCPLFVALSSQGGNALSVSLRFVLYLVPGLFAGSIFWWQKNSKFFEDKYFRKFWKFCLILSFFFAIVGNPHRSLSAIIPDSVNPWVHIPIHQQWRRGIAGNSLMKLIPKNASVASETHLIPQLAARRILLRFPENYKFKDLDGRVKTVDFIISQLRFNSDYAPAFKNHKKWVIRSIDNMRNLIESKEYGIHHCSKNGIIIAKQTITTPKAQICFQSEIEQALKIIKD